MPDSAILPVLRALALTTGVAMHRFNDLPRQTSTLSAVVRECALGQAVLVEEDDGRYLLCRYHRQQTRVIVAGPYCREDDPECGIPVLTDTAEQQLSAALQTVVVGLGRFVEMQRARLELASQLEMVGNAVIAIASELDLETVLLRIVDLARDVAGAQYAALGVPDEWGEMRAFITSGLSASQESAIGHPPRGLGILGLLLSEPRTLRLPDLAEHPASTGFPANHPPMKSFLGVPIVAAGRVLGSIYLTEKRFSAEFTDEDARLVEMLARHAAVAIQNAELFQNAEAQREWLQHIIDQLPEAIVLVETNPDRVTLANRQASILLGWDIEPGVTAHEFLEKNPRHTPDGNLQQPSEIALLRSLHGGETIQQHEVDLTRPDGHVITLLVNSVPLLDERQKVTGTIVVFQDISRIRDAEQLKDDFLSLVSHELRTPLTTIQGGAHLLFEDRGTLDDASRALLVADIHHESRRLAILVENMVQLANIRGGRFSMETEPVPVYVLLTRAVGAMRESVPEREFRINAGRELLVEGDYSRLDQIIRNLLHNAVKYAPDDAPIEATAERHDGMVTIAVRDYGPGIDPEDLPHVFERFRRGSRAVAGLRGGMGLGLYLSKHLVEAHGGRIWIERPESGGARVCFSVPVIVDDL